MTFVFLHHALSEVCSQSQIEQVSVPKLLLPCYKKIGSCLQLYVYRVRMLLRSLESTAQAELLSAFTSSNSYASSIHPQLDKHMLSMNQFFNIVETKNKPQHIHKMAKNYIREKTTHDRKFKTWSLFHEQVQFE